MIDHSKHETDKYGECGQWWGAAWWPDYKWWYARVGGQTGRWYTLWNDRLSLPGCPADAEMLSYAISPEDHNEIGES